MDVRCDVPGEPGQARCHERPASRRFHEEPEAEPSPDNSFVVHVLLPDTGPARVLNKELRLRCAQAGIQRLGDKEGRFLGRGYRTARESRVPARCPYRWHQLLPGHVPVSYTHLRAHETRHDLVCRLLLEK